MPDIDWTEWGAIFLSTDADEAIDETDGDTVSYENASGPVSVNLIDGTATGHGNDTITAINNVIGSDFADNILGDNEVSLIYGGDGNDQIGGRNGDDQIYGGAGDDGLSGGNDNDLVDGGDGNDVVFGNAGDDTLYGGAGDDLLEARAYENDYLDGGDGFDTAYFWGNQSVTVDLAIDGVWQQVADGREVYLTGFENLTGSNVADVLYGNDGDNYIMYGIRGEGDHVYARGGDDFVSYGAGNGFVFDGGDGTDWIASQTNDFLISGGVNLSLAMDGVEQDFGQGTATLYNFENISGTMFADILTGNSGANVLAGHRDNDHLIGGAGDDELYGDGIVYKSNEEGGAVAFNSGFTTFLAEGDGINPGNDTLEGGTGNDLLIGGAGDDQLWGGADDDTFFVSIVNGDDTIHDFEAGDSIVFDEGLGLDSMPDLDIQQVGSDTVITWGNDDSLTLIGTDAGLLGLTTFGFDPIPDGAGPPHADPDWTPGDGAPGGRGGGRPNAATLDEGAALSDAALLDWMATDVGGGSYTDGLALDMMAIQSDMAMF